MTKYFLQSGGVMKHPDKRIKFHRALVGDLKNPKILVCMFGQLRENWEERYDLFCKTITEDLPGVEPIFKMAMPKTFEEDCKSNDIIYMQGGDCDLSKYWLRQFDLEKIWKDKIVSGNSGTSYILAKHYWTSDWRECQDGFGIVPIKFTGHFKSDLGLDDPRGSIDWDAIYKELGAYGDTSLPVHALEEGDYIVIEQ